MKLSPFAEAAIGAATALGGRALIVGGSVRDHVLGIEPKDFDIEIQRMTEETFRGPFATTLRSIGRVDEVGVSFGVLKFGHDVDISLPRRDSKTGEGHTGFRIQVDTGMSLFEALSRRDFSMNAMAFDPITKRIIDPFSGQADMKAGVIRHIGPAFAEDPLRVMRAVQFATRFGYEIAPETAELCKSLLRELQGMAKERLWGEWEKILTKGIDFAAMHRALWETGAGQLAPGWMIMKSGHVFRSDITAHETKIARRFGDSPDKAAAILGHWAMSHKGGVPGHDEVHDLFEALDAPHDLRRRARKFRDGGILVTAWMGGHWDPADARALARKYDPVSLRSLCRAAQDTKSAVRVYRAAQAAGVLHEPHRPLLTGEDLITLGFIPGPAFGTVLKAALIAQDKGEFTTKDEAMTLAQTGKFGEMSC